MQAWRDLFPSGAMPLPNALVDALLPTLKDTELRVFLVVLRQTFGWREAERKYRERAWLSHSLLCRLTGRGSAAVSAAADALVRQGILRVETGAGEPLLTGAERQRALARLYYRLLPVDMWKTPLKPRTRKPKTTT